MSSKSAPATAGEDAVEEFLLLTVDSPLVKLLENNWVMNTRYFGQNSETTKIVDSEFIVTYVLLLLAAPQNPTIMNCTACNSFSRRGIANS